MLLLAGKNFGGIPSLVLNLPAPNPAKKKSLMRIRAGRIELPTFCALQLIL
jgi:hypothetical protein